MVWVIYHIVTGEEWFVTYHYWLANMVMYLAPKHHTLESYNRHTYDDYKGLIW